MYNTDYSMTMPVDPLEEERKRKEQELLAQQEQFNNLQTGTQMGAPVSPDQLQQQIGQVPQAGQGVQVAGPTSVSPQPKYDMGEFAGVDEQAAKNGFPVPATTVPNTGGAVEVSPGAKQQLQAPPFTQELTQNQDNVKKLWEVYNNSQYTPEQRQIAGVQLSDLMRQEGEKNKATQFIRNASPEDLNKMLASRSQEGSWAKAIMFGLLGMENSAKDEAAKLGVGAKWQTRTITDKDGNPQEVLYKVRADGLPMEGYNATTGTALSSKELAGLAGSAAKHSYEMTQAHGAPVQRTNPETGQVETGIISRDPVTNRTWVQVGNKQLDTKGWTTMSQTPINVYSAQGAGQQGKQAAQTGQGQGQLPAFGGTGQTSQAAPATSTSTAESTATTANAQPVKVEKTATGTGVKLSVGGGGGAAPKQQPGEPFSSYEARLKTWQAAQDADIQRRKEVAVAEEKEPAKARGQGQAADVKNQRFADETYSLIKPINDAIKQSTGSGIGSSVDNAAALIGAGTKGREAIARLRVLSYPILSNVPRFEGPQSDYDVQVYRQAAGDFANDKEPVSVRLAALDSMVSILKKYDKANNNDWSFGAGQAGTGTTSSGNKYKRVQ